MASELGSNKVVTSESPGVPQSYIIYDVGWGWTLAWLLSETASLLVEK